MSTDFDINDALNTYRNKSEAELMDTLKAMTDEERKSGNMDDTKLDEIYQMLYPMLSDAQRRKMEQVLGRLKR